MISKNAALPMKWEDALFVIDALKTDSPKDLESRLFIATGIYTGFRLNEMRLLTFNDLLDKEYIETEKTKGSRYRKVKINKPLQECFNDFLACYSHLHYWKPSMYLFSKFSGNLRHRNSPLRKESLLARFKAIMKRFNINLHKCSTHAMRKAFGKRVYEKALDRFPQHKALNITQAALGHSSSETTIRYIGIEFEVIDEIYDII